MAPPPTTEESSILSAFTPLSPNVHFQSSPLPSSPPAPSSDDNGPIHRGTNPVLILLMTWMDASPKHISKYITGYSIIYPSSRILLIRTTLLDMLYRPTHVQQQRLAPAIELIHSYASRSHGILLHLFSNGGAFTSTLLAKGYKDRHAAPLPVQAIAIDSAPGSANFSRTVGAVMHSLPKGTVVPLRYVAIFLVYILVAVMRSFYAVTGMEDSISKLRRGLLDPELLPGNVPRVYLYSVKDDMVHWGDVESHGAEARRRGGEVRFVRFERSGHAGHVREDGERYWGAVGEVWERGRRK